MPYDLVITRTECSIDTGDVTLEHLAARAEVHPEFIERLIACGLIRPLAPRATIVLFEQSNIRRLQSIRRLRSELGINLQGVAAILDLLERLRELQHQNDSLSARL